MADHAAETPFQKGVQALATEVDTRADVADDAMVVGVRLAERFDLTVEVTSLLLLVGADTGVEDLLLGTG